MQIKFDCLPVVLPGTETVIVLDDLSTGNADAVLYGELVIGKTGDFDLVSKLIADKDIDTVMHFAAHTIVPESVSNPLKYYANNTCSTRNLLQACQDNNVSNFIFSSTAATYGVPDESIPACHEELATAPINAYGSSKLMSEIMLRDLSAATDLKHVVLRYFNVAGSDPDGRIGQSTPEATLLIKVIEKPRRAGDPPSLIAAVDKIHRTLDWTPSFDDLDVIVRTSLAWEKTLQARSHNSHGNG